MALTGKCDVGKMIDMKKIILMISIISLIFLSGCIEKSEHEPEHEPSIYWIKISINVDKFDIKPLNISNDNNITEIIISIGFVGTYLDNSINFTNKNHSDIWDISSSSFPDKICNIFMYDHNYSFNIYIDILSNNSEDITYQYNGFLRINKPDELVVNISHIEKNDYIKIEKDCQSEATLIISNLEMIFSVGLLME